MDKKRFKELKEQAKLAKIKNSDNKTVINNHVDKKNFSHSFNGVEGIFTSIFGT